MPTYGGTLAAVRALGSAGVKVIVAGTELLAPARWSRHVHRSVRCPDPRDLDRFTDWLLRFGEHDPGYFLYPTSDDLAWLFAARSAELRRSFLLFQPPLSTLVQLLDKRRLHTACTEVGLATMTTWFPSGMDEVERLAGEVPFPLVIKPRTQVLLSTRNHGELVHGPDELVRRYRSWLARDRYLPEIERDFGDVSAPMLQRFAHSADLGVYSLSGFVTRDGAQLGARAARKVLQRPTRVGVGMCFEEAPVIQPVLEGLLRLCRHVGYHGVFEAELVVEGDRHQLIDFNPRFYGQMAFESARGLPLPLFAYHAARQDQAELGRLAAQARAHDSSGSVYAFRFAHAMLLTLGRVAGTVGPEERGRWKRWYAEHRGRTVDALFAPDDWMPALVDGVQVVWSALRHPRAYYRHILRNGQS
jgi:D-aspartate ligase